jgi:UDP:flavonoid glycosyltransferase YjiC (YdhE family)
MANLLFVTWDGGGNVPPLLGIAVELQRRGHTVRVLGHPDQDEEVRRAGLTLTAYTSARPFRGTDPHSPPEMIATFGDRGMGRDLLAEVAREPADLAVFDCLLLGAMEAARQTGLRYVIVEHLFDAYYRKRWLRGPIGVGLGLKRLGVKKSLAAAERSLVATLPELDPGSGRAGLSYTGPVVSGVPATPVEPAILVSLSTFNFPGMTEVLQGILDACEGLSARLVVTTGPVIDPADLRIPTGAEVHRFMPHAELMPQVSLVIGHGGHATTMIALAHDLPLLVIPMHPMLDQPMVGAAVEAAGAGRTLPKDTRPEQLRPVIAELLGEGPHREVAARLGASIRSRNGAKVAADLIDGLVTQGSAKSRPNASAT